MTGPGSGADTDDLPEFLERPEAVGCRAADELAELVAQQRQDRAEESELPQEIDFRGLVEEPAPADQELTVVTEAELASGPVELDDLEALLAESLSARSLEARVKADRKRLAAGAGDLSPEEREKLRATILRWETDYEWQPLAFVALVEEQVCSHCAARATHFIGLYQRQQSRRDESAHRFVLWTPQLVVGDAARLPREHARRHREVPVCGSCLPLQEFHSACPWPEALA